MEPGERSRQTSDNKPTRLDEAVWGPRRSPHSHSPAPQQPRKELLLKRVRASGEVRATHSHQQLWEQHTTTSQMQSSLKKIIQYSQQVTPRTRQLLVPLQCARIHCCHLFRALSPRWPGGTPFNTLPHGPSPCSSSRTVTASSLDLSGKYTKKAWGQALGRILQRYSSELCSKR